MSKGSKARPFDVKYDDFANSWDAIFGKKNKVEESDKKDVKEEKPKTDESTKTK